MFTQQLLELHRGQVVVGGGVEVVEIVGVEVGSRRTFCVLQGMEIYWRDNFLCPSEEDYRLMISRKTGQCNVASQQLNGVSQQLQFVKSDTTKLNFQVACSTWQCG